MEEKVNHGDVVVSYDVLVIEPFFGGSHKQLLSVLLTEILVPPKHIPFLCNLPARKWKWCEFLCDNYIIS